ncbi:hypothetical protein KJ605_02345 [Patescibacteria group bacterium]|nr:hypothetical protein [Patescibacteria group bacterium]
MNQLFWDDFSWSHISKHLVSIELVEEVLQDRQTKFVKAGSDRFFVLGRTGSCLLSIVLKKEDCGKYYVVTARSMSEPERRFYNGRKS